MSAATPHVGSFGRKRPYAQVGSVPQWCWLGLLFGVGIALSALFGLVARKVPGMVEVGALAPALAFLLAFIALVDWLPAKKLPAEKRLALGCGLLVSTFGFLEVALVATQVPLLGDGRGWLQGFGPRLQSATISIMAFGAFGTIGGGLLTRELGERSARIARVFALTSIVIATILAGVATERTVEVRAADVYAENFPIAAELPRVSRHLDDADRVRRNTIDGEIVVERSCHSGRCAVSIARVSDETGRAFSSLIVRADRPLLVRRAEDGWLLQQGDRGALFSGQDLAQRPLAPETVHPDVAPPRAWTAVAYVFVAVALVIAVRSRRLARASERVLRAAEEGTLDGDGWIALQRTTMDARALASTLPPGPVLVASGHVGPSSYRSTSSVDGAAVLFGTLDDHLAVVRRRHAGDLVFAGALALLGCVPLAASASAGMLG